MKKILVLVLLIFLFLPTQVFANGAGLPPFFRVNDKLSTPNPLQIYGITSQSFLIPQDYTQENYIINEPINFKVDTQPLGNVIAPQLLQNTKFVWDYGDGSPKADGLENTHAYNKIGSYILILTVNIYIDPNQPPTQFIDSFLLNVLPDQDYKNLPKAIITIDDQQVKNVLKKPIEKDFNHAIYFDAASSSDHSAKIVSYLWNFGDGETSTQKSVKHTYANKRFFNTVVLRVKDSSGFISDAFVGIKNNSMATVSSPSYTPVSLKKTSTQGFNYVPVALTVLFILIMASVFFFLIKRKR
ncbi:MAG: PKD domain-containing protein [Candidatus Levyibacteriota bacterium]